MIKKMWSTASNMFTALGWITLVFGGTIAGLVLAGFSWIAANTDWITDLGPIAVVGAGAILALIFTSIILAICSCRYIWIRGSAAQLWLKSSDSVNPLENEFTRKRISINQIAHPILRTIENKRFIECDLIGPGVLFMMGPGTFTDTHFVDCDVVVITPDLPFLDTAVVVKT